MGPQRGSRTGDRIVERHLSQAKAAVWVWLEKTREACMRHDMQNKSSQRIRSDAREQMTGTGKARKPKTRVVDQRSARHCEKKAEPLAVRAREAKGSEIAMS